MFDLHNVLGEDQTIDIALSGRSISRVGEGELRLATGTSIKSQIYDSKLAREMCQVMEEPSKAFVCLPRLWPEMPNQHFWIQFNRPEYAKYYKFKQYGSSFISRPDMANNIDNEIYWNKVRSIWKDRNVTLVSHGMVLKMPEASNVNLIKAAAVNAYTDINQIEEQIGKPSGPVILCLGAAATVLSVRLANKSVWTLDLGHLGHFLPHMGAYSMDQNTLISKDYIIQNKELHARPEGYGGSGHKNAADVLAFAQLIGATRILDMGCGQGSLRIKLRELKWKGDILEFDPAISGKDTLPKPADLVVSTDVLEHVEPDKLEANIAYIYKLAKKAAFFAIATRPANKTLPDGRNAHLIIEPAAFWVNKIQEAGFKINATKVKIGHDIKLWCVK